MSIEIAGIIFDRVRYDTDGDVLYLPHGDPSTATEFDASPEGPRPPLRRRRSARRRQAPQRPLAA